MELAPDATRGQRSAASLATGPVIALPVSAQQGDVVRQAPAHSAPCRGFSSLLAKREAGGRSTDRRTPARDPCRTELNRHCEPADNTRGPAEGGGARVRRHVGRTLHLALRVDDHASVVWTDRRADGDKLQGWITAGTKVLEEWPNGEGRKQVWRQHGRHLQGAEASFPLRTLEVDEQAVLPAERLALAHNHARHHCSERGCRNWRQGEVAVQSRRRSQSCML